MNQDTTKDLLSFDDQNKGILPSGLNVLTILTFIGCGVQMLLTLCSPWLLNFSKTLMDKAESSGQELTPKQLDDFAKAREIIAVTEKNLVPMLIIGVVGIMLCFIGALWMRKFKKDGYWMYIAGQVVPIISGIVFMGKYQFADWKSYLGTGITALFIILYTVNKKYLTK